MSPLVNVLTWHSNRTQLQHESDGARGAQERPTLSRRCLSLTLCSKSTVCKKFRWWQKHPCSLQRKNKLQELWLSRESSFVHRIRLAHRTCLPALAPDTIRRAAREFSTHTPASTGGFAMRHFALLSDDALTLASQLFECIEALGTIPQQLRYVAVVLIPKATSGLRLIGSLLCAPPIVGKLSNGHGASLGEPAPQALFCGQQANCSR